MRYNVGASTRLEHGKDVTELVVTRVPWWADLLETITDRVCVLLRHRWCHLVVGPAMTLAERHAEEWRTPVTRDTAKDCLRWLGVDDWLRRDKEE